MNFSDIYREQVFHEAEKTPDQMDTIIKNILRGYAMGAIPSNTSNDKYFSQALDRINNAFNDVNSKEYFRFAERLAKNCAHLGLDEKTTIDKRFIPILHWDLVKNTSTGMDIWESYTSIKKGYNIILSNLVKFYIKRPTYDGPAIEWLLSQLQNQVPEDSECWTYVRDLRNHTVSEGFDSTVFSNLVKTAATFCGSLGLTEKQTVDFLSKHASWKNYSNRKLGLDVLDVYEKSYSPIASFADADKTKLILKAFVDCFVDENFDFKDVRISAIKQRVLRDFHGTNINESDLALLDINTLKQHLDELVVLFGKSGVPAERMKLVLNQYASYMSLSNQRRSELEDKYLKAYTEYEKNLGTQTERAKTEFKTAYKNKRSEIISEHPEDKDKYIITKPILDLLSKLISEGKFGTDKEVNGYEALGNHPSLKEKANLGWIESFVGSSEIYNTISTEEKDRCILSVESDIHANTTNDEKVSPEQEWRNIVEQFNKLVTDFNTIFEDKNVKKMVSNSEGGGAALRGAGNAISTITLTLGALTYAFSALIPGGSQYGAYLSGLIKNGRRIGKLLTNKGSTLEYKNSRNEKKFDNEPEVVKDSKRMVHKKSVNHNDLLEEPVKADVFDDVAST